MAAMPAPADQPGWKATGPLVFDGLEQHAAFVGDPVAREFAFTLVHPAKLGAHLGLPAAP